MISTNHRLVSSAPEARLHRAVADFLTLSLLPPAIWTTIGHGGGGRIRGAQLKRMGLRAGWPDVQLLIPAGIHTRFIGIELKAPRGVVSDEQQVVHAMISRAGGIVFVCRSVDEVYEALRDLGVPLRVEVKRTLAGKAA